ncbi:TetR/AcrR family transcriptional regulator [Ornithinimicrobium pratense]|uniref:TetR/AcrR family transcriptional regulator n=1 Tax=Ornithinimicrobium pratense TaxID=2593973 RepID=A0A5J6V3E5_9MICO|nr:TetR/AcrR family transcriptional regulator [Ornithinimicrobium pratense]QFG68208.1 TetR/AcrR family transcriptional regulator [Ornithinimicrobium pratense]
MEAEDDSAEVLQMPPLTAGARRLVEVASELFYRHGIHAVGVDTIAAESGITKRTLYDRFGSKDQLVAVYLQARHQRWWERMERRVARESESPVLALFDSYAQDSESSDRGCAFINAAAELPADHPAYRVVRAHKRAVLDRLVELLGPGSASHQESVAVAQEIYLLLEGAIAHRGIDGDDQLLRRAREIAVWRLHDRSLNATAHR